MAKWLLNTLTLILIIASSAMAAQIQRLPTKPDVLSQVPPIEKRLLDDQAKLGQSYSAQTRAILENLAGQFMLQILNLPPKQTLRDAAASKVSAAFPATTAKSELDGYVFWVVIEATNGAQQDYSELLVQWKLVTERQKLASDLLAQVQERLGQDQSTSQAGGRPSLQSAALYTKNLHVAYHPAPVIPYTPQDIDRATRAQLHEMETKLDTLGDDAQLANVELQNALQQQQQTLQMLSTISKLCNDTAMAVIRKIGG